MATAPMAPVNTAGNIESVLKLIQGGSDLFKGSSTTSTTRSDISQQGVNQLLQNILASNQGLGAVSGAQRSAGLYNSSTNQMLINDLLARATGEVESRRAGTTTTTKKNPQLGAADILSLLGTSAASSVAGKVLGPTVKGLGKKVGLDDAGAKLADLLGVGTGGNVVTAEGIAGTSSGFATNAAGELVGAGSASLDSLAGIGASSFTDALLGAGLAEGAGYALATEGIGTAGAALLADGTLVGAGSAALDAAAGISAAATAAEGIGTAATLAEGATIAAEGTGIVATLVEIGSWIASLFSDERLKTDITPVGKTNEGQNIYTYKYVDNPITTHMGVLAQETLKRTPEAVTMHPIGALMVDYSKIK